MADIFISYASEDRDRVKPLAKALEEHGWSVFWDINIPVGKTWRQAITEELKAAKCAVVVWSSTSINSKWVHEEAEEAQERQILVPVLIDKVKPPFGFRGMQSAKLMKWAGESNHPEFVKLLEPIEAIFSRSPFGDIKLPEPKTDSASSSEPEHTLAIAPKLRSTSNELKVGMFAGVAVLLMFGIFWYLSQSQKAITNSIGMKFVLLPAGNFVMGSPSDEPGRKNDEEQHEVRFSRPFYLQTTEVTQGQWERVMGNIPYNSADHATGRIPWNETQEFISKLNQMENTNKYRLPTESEWEYACRAGTETAYSFGDDVDQIGEYAWYRDNANGRVHPVGQKKPNAWGLYDMLGNVWEWCQDWYGDYPSHSVTDPKGPEKSFSRVMRGGSYYYTYPPSIFRSAKRGTSPYGAANDIGFRVARDF